MRHFHTGDDKTECLNRIFLKKSFAPVLSTKEDNYYYFTYFFVLFCRFIKYIYFDVYWLNDINGCYWTSQCIAKINVGQHWQSSFPFQIYFEAESGLNVNGDIALDEVFIFNENCGTENCNNASPSLAVVVWWVVNYKYVHHLFNELLHLCNKFILGLKWLHSFEQSWTNDLNQSLLHMHKLNNLLECVSSHCLI